MEDFLLLVLHHCRSKAMEHEVQPCSQHSGGGNAHGKQTVRKQNVSASWPNPEWLLSGTNQAEGSSIFLTQHPWTV